MVYYNRILRVWMFDPLDYFLISAFLGSIVASRLKNHLSEKESMERLKKSIINKSKLIPSKSRILNPKDDKIRRIYKFALDNRGGDNDNFNQMLEEINTNHEFSNEVFKLTQEIEKVVARLAKYLKERELKGVLKIFLKSGRLILELLLYKCNIDMSYTLLTEELSTQVIVFTITAGGAAGFTLSWFSVGAALVTPPLIISVLLLRSLRQQISNQRDYLKFKKMINKMLAENDLKDTLRAMYMEVGGPTNSYGKLKMGPLDSDTNLILQHDFNSESGKDIDEFIKERMKEEFGLIENPTERQLQEIIQGKVKRKRRGKTVYFRDFVDEMADHDADLAGPDIIDLDIVDAEIIKEPIRLKSDDSI